MERAMGETARRRDIQLAYNKEHGITPKTITKSIKDITEALQSEHEKAVNLDLDMELGKIEDLPPKKREVALKKIIRKKEIEMEKAVAELDFETAAIVRDELIVLREM
jgi:excinuclease ABC subunit B